jgi:GntR family transcriptional regulator/MocR family aminotransferase
MKASSGIELMVALERDSGVPLRAQLEQQLRDGARAGRLAPGAPLPSTRALARELGVARGVVSEAYAQLAAEGYLVARQGAPTRVAERAPAPPATAPPADVDRRPRFDFRPGAPDVALFPRQAWAAALRQALREAPDARLEYGDGRGAPELRRALASYLGRVRGVAAAPEAVVVTSGVAQGLALSARTLLALGVRRIAVEEPGSGPIRAQLAANGLEPLPVRVDEGGLDVVALERSDAEAVFCTPAHQFPTGVVLAPGRRAALLQWATARGAFVLEDDYDAEYRYDRPPVGALQGLDPDRVLYAGSVSKTLAPGLRIGWLVTPESLAKRIGDGKATDDRGTPVLEQLGLAILLDRGEVDRHVRRSRLVYRRRRDLLVASLADHLPQARPQGAAAGLHLIVQLPAGLDDRAVAAAAAERGIAVAALSEHRARPGGPALILGYGRIAEAAIDKGIRELAAAITRAPAGGASSRAAPRSAASPTRAAP